MRQPSFAAVVPLDEHMEIDGRILYAAPAWKRVLIGVATFISLLSSMALLFAVGWGLIVLITLLDQGKLDDALDALGQPLKTIVIVFFFSYLLRSATTFLSNSIKKRLIENDGSIGNL